MWVMARISANAFFIMLGGPPFIQEIFILAIVRLIAKAP
jgi:hypothetical protein